MLEALKNCPFCDASDSENNACQEAGVICLEVPTAVGAKGWQVVCRCGASSPKQLTEAEAIAAWNRRGTPTADERVVEALAQNVEKTADRLAMSLGVLLRDWMTGPNPLEGDGLEHVIKLRIHRLLTEAALASLREADHA